MLNGGTASASGENMGAFKGEISSNLGGKYRLLGWSDIHGSSHHLPSEVLRTLASKINSIRWHVKQMRRVLCKKKTNHNENEVKKIKRKIKM